MATITKHTFDQTEVSNLQSGKTVVQNTIDFSATGDNVSAADVVQAIKIPSGALVTKVYVKVDTAEGATCTATVGDGTTADGWDASTNLNATADTVTTSLEATDTYVGGKYYSADDTIDLTMGHDTDAAIVTVLAEYLMLNA